MTLTNHAVKRLYQRAPQCGATPSECIKQLRSMRAEGVVGIVLASVPGLNPGVQHYLIAICKDGTVVTVERNSTLEPRYLKVERVI